MQTATPKVSVVIPSYNHATYLPQRIESVLQQTFRDIEVIILDDCSPDNSRDIIEHYAALDARIRVVHNEKNSGSTFRQWNKGFALAKGEYIWIAESDDYADPRLLESLVQQLDSNHEVGVAYCNSATVDENGSEINVLDNFYSELGTNLWTQDFVKDGRLLITSYMFYCNIFPNASAVLIRKSVLDKVGKADESYKLNGDWVFWASLIAESKVAYIANKHNYFRFHLNNVRSKSHDKGLALFELTKVVRTMHQYGEPNPQLFIRMINALNEAWFYGIVTNSIPLKRQLNIYRNIKGFDADFNTHLLFNIKKHLLNNNFSGLRQLLGDGMLYRIGKKKPK